MTPQWQLALLASLPRPLAIACIMLGNIGISVLPSVLTVAIFAASTLFWAYVGLRYHFHVWLIFAIWGFALPAICTWMYEEYRKLDKYIPKREKDK